MSYVGVPTHDAAYIVGLRFSLAENLRRSGANLGGGLPEELVRAPALVARIGEQVEATQSFRKVSQALRSQIDDQARQMASNQTRLGELKHEMEGLARRRDVMDRQMQKLVGNDEPYLRARRRRAEFDATLTQRQETAKRLEETLALQRAEQTRCQIDWRTREKQERALRAKLESDQRLLPRPSLYFEHFTRVVALAHCELLLGGTVDRWREHTHQATRVLTEVHHAISRGLYPSEDIVALAHGRAGETAEALCLLVAHGAFDEAVALFELVLGEIPVAHQLDHAFKLACLGFYLGGQMRPLGNMLRPYRYAQGIRGAWAGAWWALLSRDGEELGRHLKQLTVYEWRHWRRSPTPGLGLVATGVLALGRIAEATGLRVDEDFGPTVPKTLRDML